MAVRSVLVPTDFSETSDAALHYATEMALTLGARLYLMYVPGKTGEHFEANYPLGQFETATRERLSSFLTKEQLERLRPDTRCASVRRPRRSCATRNCAMST